MIVVRRALLPLSGAVLVGMVLVPPYFAIYDDEAPAVHGPIGYHPFWAPPSPADAHQLLLAELAGQPNARGAVERLGTARDPARSIRVRVNLVRLAMQLAALAVVTLGLKGLTALTGKRRPG